MPVKFDYKTSEIFNFAALQRFGAKVDTDVQVGLGVVQIIFKRSSNFHV